MRRAAVAAGAAVLLLVPACSPGPDGAAPEAREGCSPQPAAERTVQVAGRSMRYLVAGDRGAQRPPVLLLLHGAGSRPEDALAGSGLAEAAEQARSLVVAPEGTGSPRGWVTFTGSGLADTLERQLLAVLDDVGRRDCADVDGVVAVGVSNGAAMAALLACVADGRVAAAVLVAGTSFPGRHCAGAAAVSVLAVHGDQDRVFEGFQAYSPAGCCVGLVLWPPSAAVQRWAEHDGCTGSSRAEPAPGLVEERSTGCRDGTEVVLVTVAGSGHGWPDLPGLADRVLGLLPG